jgi:hypothetical protein
MRQRLVGQLTAAVVGLLLSSAAFTADGSAADWQAAQRANNAQEALSERYTAIWATLDRTQKTRFSAQERAWLNEGREMEQQACLQRAGGRSELAVHTCKAEVVERRLRALGAPARAAASR